jgi:hypothetical protein
MRNNIIILFISIICIDTNGSTYGVMIGNIDNVYYSGFVAGETQYQNQAIAYLCNEFIKSNYPSFKEKVFLELGFKDNNSCKLSYDKFQGEMWENGEHNRPTKGNGIRIQFSQSNNRAESVLKLLDFGINNLKSLKKSRKVYYSLDYYDRPNDLTVDTISLKQLLKNNSKPNIESILKLKVYRNLGTEAYKLNKEYYFQNDKYYFIDFFKNDSVYLQLEQIHQIISDYYLGTLIFETDSTGYFYNRETKSLSSKFTIDNKQDSFYYSHTSTDKKRKRIYFEYDTYLDDKIKFIYLADRLILIQKVEQLEDEMIENEIKIRTKG